MQPNEERESDDLQRLLRESYPTPAPNEQFANRLQGQLLALLQPARDCPEPARRRKLSARWLRELTAAQRIGVALSGACAAALAGLLLLWGGIDAKPVSAMEKMAESIRQAKSYKTTGTETMTFMSAPGDPGKTAEKTRQTTKDSYWLAPDWVRVDITQPSAWKGPGPEISIIVRGASEPWISIDNRAKTFLCYPPRKGAAMERSFSLDKLGAYSGRADRELGTKVIHGKRTRGFAINVKKINPDCRAAGLFEIWLDSETNLPVFLRYEIKAEDLSVITEQCDIQWNVELDPKLFDPKPPAGYRDVTPKPTARGK